jgi:hypothetical protein
MTIVSAADFALHVQDYLDQAAQGKEIKIKLYNEQFVLLVVAPIEKSYTKEDLLQKLSYFGQEADSRKIDESIY